MYARAYHSHIDINLLELAKMENAHTVHARGREYKYPLRSSLLERLDNLFLQKPWEKNAGILFPTLTQRASPTEFAVPPQYNGKCLLSQQIDAIEGTPIFSPPDELSDFLYNPGRTIFPPLLPIPTSEGNKRSLTSWGTTPSVSPPIVPSENYLRGAQQQKGTDLAEAWLAQPRSSIVQTRSVSPSIVRSETSSTVFIYRIQCVI